MPERYNPVINYDLGWEWNYHTNRPFVSNPTNDFIVGGELPHSITPKRTRKIETIENEDGYTFSIMVDHVEKARVFDVHTAVKVALMFEREDS